MSDHELESFCGDKKIMPRDKKDTVSQKTEEDIVSVFEKNGSVPEREKENITPLLESTGVTSQWEPDTDSHTENNYQKIQEEIQSWLY